MQTQDQKRASHAYAQVQAITDKKEKFKPQALKFPVMVLQCGLLQTLAFYEAEKEEQRVFGAFNEWLTSHAQLTWISHLGSPITSGNILERTCQLDLPCYRMVAREAIAYGSWLKRATESLLKDVVIDGD